MVPGTPSVLFFKATLPLKPANIIALKIGHLAFQAPQNQGACLYIICYLGLPFLSFGKHIAKPTIDEQSHTKLHWVWFFNQYLKINTELYSDNSDTQHHHPTPCFGFGKS